MTFSEVYLGDFRMDIGTIAGAYSYEEFFTFKMQYTQKKQL